MPLATYLVITKQLELKETNRKKILTSFTIIINSIIDCPAKSNVIFNRPLNAKYK